MTALETLKEELRKVQEAQAECMSESGVIKSYKKYEYMILTQTARDLKGSIDWMTALYGEK